MMRNLFWLGTCIVLCGVGAAFGQIQTAGTLLVDLDANDASAGTATWTNNGTLGNFTKIGSPHVLPGLGGAASNAVSFNLFNTGGDVYRGPVTSGTGIEGAGATRSIEVWAYNPTISNEETLVSWARRGGGTGSNMSFNHGSNGSFGAVGHWSTPDLGWGTVPTAGEWHHLVYTYDGNTTRVYSDGVETNNEVVGVLGTHTGNNINVAAQNLSSGAVDFNQGLIGHLAVGKVRIHDGVLTPAQITNNFNEEQAQFAAQAVGGPAPIHRYSFDEAAGGAPDGTTIVDSIGGANGVVRGAGANSNGTGLQLPGGSSGTQAYVDLPNGIISGIASGDATIEAFVTPEGSQNWQRIFDIGSGTAGELTGPGGSASGDDYIMVSANRGGNINQQRFEVRNQDGGGTNFNLTGDSDIATTLGDLIHVAVVIDQDGNNGDPTATYYRDGQPLSSIPLPSDYALNLLNDENSWLGRSQFTGDANFQGIFEEFRIYDEALTGQQILGNFQAGPDQLNLAAAVPEPSSVLIWTLFGMALAGYGYRRRRAKVTQP